MHDLRGIQGRGPDINIALTDEDGAFDLPDFNDHGLLPALEFGEAGDVVRRGPYGCSTTAFRARFGGTAQRQALIDKLMLYRDDLRSAGMRVLFQWVSGTLVDEAEDPDGYDVVSFYSPPMHVKAPSDMLRFMQLHHELFVKFFARSKYGCEPNYVLLTAPPVELIRSVTLWTNQMAHARPSGLQRGFIVLGGLGPARATG